MKAKRVFFQKREKLAFKQTRQLKGFCVLDLLPDLGRWRDFSGLIQAILKTIASFSAAIFV